MARIGTDNNEQIEVFGVQPQQDARQAGKPNLPDVLDRNPCPSVLSVVHDFFTIHDLFNGRERAFV